MAGQQAQQRLARKRAGLHRCLVTRQCRGQAGGLECRGALGVQRAHPQLLGPIMALIKILGATAEARRRSQQRPARRFVGRAAEHQLTIDKTLHRHNRVAMHLQPIRREPPTTQAQSPSGQVGKLLPLHQQRQPAVLRQQMPPLAQLLG
jgi:hypothetical protein